MLMDPPLERIMYQASPKAASALLDNLQTLIAIQVAVFSRPYEDLVRLIHKQRR
jgi:hypothetical protein